LLTFTVAKILKKF